jgi:DNA-binding response OmpR family regulator
MIDCLSRQSAVSISKRPVSGSSRRRTATRALAVVKADRPDVILVDIMMPRVSGWEVAAALIAGRTTDRILIIFITARSGVPDRIRALELGAQAYLTKPFDLAGLATTVTKFWIQSIEASGTQTSPRRSPHSKRNKKRDVRRCGPRKQSPLSSSSRTRRRSWSRRRWWSFRRSPTRFPR